MYILYMKKDEMIEEIMDLQNRATKLNWDDYVKYAGELYETEVKAGMVSKLGHVKYLRYCNKTQLGDVLDTMMSLSIKYNF